MQKDRTQTTATTRTSIAANALKAQPAGDVLRVARSIHPTSVRVELISEAQAAVTESAVRLERAARNHQRKLARLAVLRQRAGLEASPVPAVEELVRPNVPNGWLVGQIIERDRLSMESKTFGKVLLTSGQVLSWAAGSHYVDTLEPLFNGIPVMFTGTIKYSQGDDGLYSIGSIKAAPPEFWPVGQIGDYQAATEYDARLIEEQSNARKALLDQHDSCCLDCLRHLSKPSKASLIVRSTGYRLVCRPCKQLWIDAGRPEATTKAVAA